MKIKILGIQIDKDYTVKKVIKKIEEAIGTGSKLFITTVNPEMVMLARKDEEFKNILNSAGISLPDGFGIKCAAFYYLKRLKVITGCDLTEKICKAAGKNGYKIFLLGGLNHVAEMTKIKLEKKYPGLNIVGAEQGIGPDNFSYDKKEVIDMINKAEPDILFVAFGAPKQEKWIYYNLPKLSTVNVAMGIGGTFDFLSGIASRAPLLMRLAGLEWLWRFAKEPKRSRRIFAAVIKFPFAVVFRKK